MKKLISIGLVALSLAACAKSNDTQTAREQVSTSSPSGGGGSTGNVTVNGMSPKDYFDQFLYQKKGECGKENGIYYEFASTYFDHILLPEKFENGRDQIAEIALILLKDGSCMFDYDEWVHAPNEWNESTYSLQRATRRICKWQVHPEGYLEIEEIGTATALKINDKPGMMFTLGVDIISKGVAGKQVTLTKVYSTSGKMNEPVTNCQN